MIEKKGRWRREKYSSLQPQVFNSHLFFFTFPSFFPVSVLASLSPQAPVSALAFSPMSPLLISTSWDRTVRLWDIFEHKESVEPVRLWLNGVELLSKDKQGRNISYDQKYAVILQIIRLEYLPLSESFLFNFSSFSTQAMWLRLLSGRTVPRRWYPRLTAS